MSAMHRHDPLVGSLIDGRYGVVRLLGGGGMGNVYVAEEKRLRRRCALKVLHPHLGHDHVHVERFLREAQMIAQFKHPNIVDIFASGEEPAGVVYFAMELLEGEDLDARLAARPERPFSVKDCCLWGIQVARAVGVVHAAGLIHRDLKTGNIFLARRHDGEEIVKLLDFGIARREASSELTGTGVALGTPSYMAPEQFQDGEIDRRVDIYAFGVVLYRLLTGRLPFTGDMIQLAMKHRNVQPSRPSKIAPEAGISVKVESVVLKCMAKQPAERYASMQAVEDALAAALPKEAVGSSFSVRRMLLGNSGDSKLLPAAVLPAAVLPAAVAPAAVVPNPALCTQSVTRPVLVHQTEPTAPSAIASRPRLHHLVLVAGIFAMSTLLAGLSWIEYEPSSSPGAGESTSRSPAADPPEPVSLQPVAPVWTRSDPPEPSGFNPPAVAATPAAVQTSARPTEQAIPAVVQARPSVPSLRHQPPRPDDLLRPINPIRQIHMRARACRRKFKAVDGLRIVVSYWVGVDGKAHEATPSVHDELGACLAAAVSKTQFEPKLELSKKIDL